MSLKVYNSRGWGRANYDDKTHDKLPTPLSKWTESVYSCGHNRKDIVRYIQLAGGGSSYTVNELSNYGSPQWGNSMEGIDPQPGVWADQGYNKPPTLLLRGEVLLVQSAVVTEIQNFLDVDQPVPDAGLDEMMNSFTVVFGNGIEADIKFCNGDTGPWIDAVLFKDGCEVHVLEVSDTLEGEYPFEYEGVMYIAHLRTKAKMKDIYKQLT